MLNQYVPRPIRVPPPTSLSATNLPSIAIVTPSYNQAAYIAKTMESVLSHNYPKLQYVVQDGGSTDATPDLLDRYAPRLSHAESAKDAGQADAINRGFARTTGEIMAYLNSDDLLLPGTLQYVGAFFAAHPEVDVIYGHRIVINENDQDVGRWLLPAHDSEVLSWADYVPQETLFWRRSVWEKAGGAMDESFRFALDWDLILRFRETGATFKRLPRFLGAFRIHTQQKTSKDMLTIGQQEMFRLRQRALGRQVTQGEINERIKPYLERHLWEHVRYRLSTRILASQYITFTPEPTSIST
ncbi:MAG: glycosyltransferase [Anaerolineae bacterium]|nr:glycosyltransferase [Anaerolineae bacterium]